MMRSLRFKWSFTLFATSLAGILLVGVIATSVNYREFRRHRDRELRSLYGRLVGEFYKRNKAWDKIDIIRTGNYVDKPLMEADSIDAETALHSSIVERLHGASFVVADEDGLVVQPAGDYRAGDKLRPGETSTWTAHRVGWQKGRNSCRRGLAGFRAPPKWIFWVESTCSWWQPWDLQCSWPSLWER